MSVRPSQGTPVKVVIIGAGLAGLAAAHKLSTTVSKNVTFDVKLLEAKPYPGGRAHSVQWSNGKYTTELGAHFLYCFESATNLTDFVEQKKLASTKTTDGSYCEIFTSKASVHLLSDGAEIKSTSAKFYEKIFLELIDEMCECSSRNGWSYVIKKQWPKLNEKCFDPKVNSVADYLKMRFFEVTEASPSLPLPQGCSPKHIFDRMMVYEAFNNGTSDLANIDMRSYNDYEIPSGQYTDKSNYSDIVSALVEELPANTLRCSSVVSSIKWSPKTTRSDIEGSSPQVAVSCEDGTVYNAHHVIITPSLGVLKAWIAANTIAPPLPTAKLDAISKLGMGEGCCAQFEFAAPLLDRDHQLIEFFWLKEDLEKFAKFPWAQSLDSLIKQGESNVYTTFLTERKARALERSTEAEIAEGICQLLKMFLKKPIPPLTEIQCGRWTSDPYTLGVYSYCPVGSDKRDRVALSQPVDGTTPLQLLFAGEATHPTKFSTTNGAFDTGVKEAECILQHYEQH